MLLFVYYSFESTQSHEEIKNFFNKALIIINMLMYGKEKCCWQTEGHFACVIQIYFQICLDNDKTFENMSRTFFIHLLCYICIVNLKVVCRSKSVLGTN